MIVMNTVGTCFLTAYVTIHVIVPKVSFKRLTCGHADSLEAENANVLIDVDIVARRSMQADKKTLVALLCCVPALLKQENTESLE